MNAIASPFLSIAALLFAVPASAQDPAPAPDSGGDIVSFTCHGADAWFRSPKDRALHGALRMLSARLAELPGETGEPDEIPPGLLPVFERLAFGPLSLRIGVVGEDSAAGLPVYAKLEIPPVEGQEPFFQSFSTLLEASGTPAQEPDAEGRTPLPLPVPAWYRDVAGTFALEIGEVHAADASAPPSLPAGAEPALEMKLDYGRMIEAMKLGADTPLERERMEQMAETFGLDALKLDVVIGSDAERGYERYTMRGYAGTPISKVFLSAPIPPAALQRIPIDVEWASVMSWDPAGLAQMYAPLVSEALDARGESPEALGELLGMEDFELQRDLLQYMGPTQIFFSSRAAGGGLCSTVACFALTDPDAFVASLERLEARLEERLSEEARGYVHVEVSDRDGARYASLQFPGLPIPIEPTWTVADGYLVVGPSYRAVQAACDHARSGRPSLPASSGFRQQLTRDPSEVYALSYFDVPGLLADGYPVADAFTTALANTVRSRAGAEGEPRRPGRLLPSYHELSEGVLPLVSESWIDGEDVVADVRGDRSLLVNATALAPYISKLYVAGFLGGFAASAADAKAKSAGVTDRQHRALSEIEEIHAALDTWAGEHAGTYPDDLEVLVRRDRDGHRVLDRPSVPHDPWGRPYCYLAPDEQHPRPRVFSLGEDGARGGTGESLDLRRGVVPPRVKSPFEELLETFE